MLEHSAPVEHGLVSPRSLVRQFHTERFNECLLIQGKAAMKRAFVRKPLAESGKFLLEEEIRGKFTELEEFPNGRDSALRLGRASFRASSCGAGIWKRQESKLPSRRTRPALLKTARATKPSASGVSTPPRSHSSARTSMTSRSFNARGTGGPSSGLRGPGTLESRVRLVNFRYSDSADSLELKACQSASILAFDNNLTEA